jgi:prepilin-type N-terminal cleavage/methylation domain-containing protein
MLLLGSLIQRLSLRQHFLAHKGSRGFTQIEMAITVVVIGALAAIVAPSLQQWQQQRKVDQAVIILENAIRETQAEAVKRGQRCELSLQEGFNPSANGASPLIDGDCVIKTNDFELVGIRLEHTRTRPIWKIVFNHKGENRESNPAGVGSIAIGAGTAIFSVPGTTTIQPRCIAVSTGIGLHRSGRIRNGDCVKS